MGLDGLGLVRLDGRQLSNLLKGDWLSLGAGGLRRRVLSLVFLEGYRP